jgi:hypothetical protein
MVPDPDDLEIRVLDLVEAKSGKSGRTIVAFALGLEQHTR